jgi:hypothetical protein
MQDKLPMKPSFVYTDQFNVRIERELKEDIRFLAGQGVEVSDLLRPVIREAVRRAKERITDKAS